MILIKLVKNKNKTIKEAYGKYYARPVVTETIGIDELAEHMSSHNTPFSKGAIKGLLTDMVSCVKELVLQNKAVNHNDSRTCLLRVSGLAVPPPPFFIPKTLTETKFQPLKQACDYHYPLSNNSSFASSEVK